MGGGGAQKCIFMNLIRLNEWNLINLMILWHAEVGAKNDHFYFYCFDRTLVRARDTPQSLETSHTDYTALSQVNFLSCILMQEGISWVIQYKQCNFLNCVPSRPL